MAATAELADLTLLHLDKDFEPIAEVTGQPIERLSMLEWLPTLRVAGRRSGARDLGDDSNSPFLVMRYLGIGIVCRNDGRMWATQSSGFRLRAQMSDRPLPPVDPIVRTDRRGSTCTSDPLDSCGAGTEPAGRAATRPGSASRIACR